MFINCNFTELIILLSLATLPFGIILYQGIDAWINNRRHREDKHE